MFRTGADDPHTRRSALAAERDDPFCRLFLQTLAMVAEFEADLGYTHA